MKKQKKIQNIREKFMARVTMRQRELEVDLKDMKANQIKLQSVRNRQEQQPEKATVKQEELYPTEKLYEYENQYL